MKITKDHLKQIIKEEISKVMENPATPAIGAGTGRQDQLIASLKDWDLVRLQHALEVFNSMGSLATPTEKEMVLALQTVIDSKSI